MKRILPLLPALVTALLIGSACTNSQDGQAEPQTSTGLPSAGSTASPSGQRGEPASTALDPCALLNAEKDLTKYGEFKEPRQKNTAGARTCAWQRIANTAEEDAVIGFAIWDDQSVEDVRDVGGGINRGEANGRPAVEAPDPRSNECTFALKIDEQSRVDVNVAAMDSVDDACQVAREVGYIIEPRLPATGS